MEKIVGVRFKKAGKIYDFICGAYVLKVGDHVIVETENGLGVGTVATPPVTKKNEELNPPVKRVYRPLMEKDIVTIKTNLNMEKRAFAYCRRCIQELGLPMNLFSTESNFDANKMTFYFTANGRVDFRKLVKMLVQEFKIKIEMRQVGIRNQAKMCGGIGRCGRELCCSAFLTKFDPVSIKMAKKQGLSLNPTKISGVCGRLMCCLTFEDDTYPANEKKNSGQGQSE